MIRRIKRLLQWIPLLWKDEDYDYVYLLEIMRFKLQLMEDHHRYEGITADRLKIAHNIRVCKLLLDRIAKDKYLDNAHNENTLEISHYMMRQDLDLFCKIFNKQVFRWWN